MLHPTVSRDIIHTVVSITVIKLEYENDYENRKRIRAQLRLLNKKKNDERGEIHFRIIWVPDRFTGRVSTADILESMVEMTLEP